MQLATLEIDRHERIGVVEGDDILILPNNEDWPGSLLALIEAGPDALARLAAELPKLRQQAARVPYTQAMLRAPIPRPRKNIRKAAQRVV